MSVRDDIESQYQVPMATFAKAIDYSLNKDARPRKHGFVLLMFEFGDFNEERRMNYISNADRETVITALKELVANFEGRVLDTPGHS